MRDFVDHRNHNRLSNKYVMDIHTGVGSPQAMEIVDESWHTGGFSWGNARYRKKDFWTDEIEEAWTKIQYGAIQRFISCFACTQQCGALIWHEEDPPYMAKCYSKLSYLFGSETDDQHFSWQILSRSFRYGVDSFSTPQVLAMAVEMRSDGVLKEEDFAATDEYPACPPPEDKQGVFLWLLDRIGKGQGIGRIFALGTKAAAEKIGVNPEHYAHNVTKGEEQMNVKLGMLDPMYFLMFATNEKQSVPQIEGNWPQDAFRDIKDREEFVKDWIHLPHERFKKYFLDWEPKSRKGGKFMNPEYPTPEIASDIVDWMEGNPQLRRLPGNLLRHGRILPETGLPCAQLLQIRLIGSRNRCGSIRAQEDYSPEPESAPGLPNEKGHDPGRRRAARGSLAAPLPRTRGKTPDDLLQLQGLER